MVEYHVRRGDALVMRSRGSVAVRVSGLITVLFRDGTLRNFPFAHTSTTDRSLRTTTKRGMPDDGIVVGVNVQTAAGAKRGEVFAETYIAEGGSGMARSWLCRGYVRVGRFLGLGEFEDPLSGRGHLHWLTVADDVTPSTGVTTTLAATNARRLVHGFAWYYHASSDSATRTMRALVHAPGTSLPTGMTVGNNTRPWSNANAISLIADQEGMMFAKDGIVSEVDNGTVAYNNNNTQPNPFPLWVEEDDDIDLDLVVGSGHTNDRHSAHILVEDWIIP